MNRSVQPTYQSTQRSEVMEHEVTRSPAYRTQQASPPPPARPTYRPAEFEVPPPAKYSDNYSSPAPPQSPPQQYSSLDSDANAWLAAQQQKLKNFKEGRDASGRTLQEKNLVNELKFAQNKYYTRRTDTEQEERSVMDQYGRQHQHQQYLNGPVSPPQQYSSSYSSYVESSRSYGDRRPPQQGTNKPPPSPTMQRSLIPPVQSAAPPPAPIPARGSSREFMQRTRSNSSSSSWQQQQQQQRSTLTRQQSDILYDRRDVEHIQPKSYGSTHSTPPLSPRAASPIRTRRENETKQVSKHPHHYHLNDKTDSSTNRLDELERNLEKASTIPQQKSSPPLQPKKAPPTQHSAPPPPKEPVQEDEILPQMKANKVFQESVSTNYTSSFPLDVPLIFIGLLQDSPV
ncbi:tensin-1-like isoform X8 [Elysia marginata]|uniref:Tensin-1-like isoform X8 n=1 Tax=Elysia marginata TaxID=1093978 RepID=A0AAV4HBS1_9GAST|nr:tensin-1-like isoform X8 [Elysia marginata]